MKFLSKVNGRIPELLGVPDQTLPGVPIIEIYGDRRVLIEGRSTVVQGSGKTTLSGKLALSLKMAVVL